MSIPTVTQTVATPPIPPTTTASAQATSFSVDSASVASGSAGAVTNPIGSISSDLQNYLLQSQGTDGQSVKGHHHHHGGSHVDAPSLPGGSTSAVTA